MHDSAYRIGELVMRTYCDLPNAKILEIGSMNVNGCLRDAAAPTTHYVGLDVEPGPSVDQVVRLGEDWPVENDSFDLVMASSVFEHDSRFWDTFLRMCRAARVGGHIYVNAPSNGTVHRYPMDCWRFYPDAGLALAEHAQTSGIEIDLVESFIGGRHDDVWNDFVAVFRKGPCAELLNTAFIYQRYPSMNARTWQSSAIYNETEQTEDMVLLAALRARTEDLATHEESLSNANIELDRLRGELKAARTETLEDSRLADRVANLESNLRQRQEEIEQAWKQAETAAAERDHLQSERDTLQELAAKLEHRVAKADVWVFDLARERRSLEGQLSVLSAKLENAGRSIEKLEANAKLTKRELQERNAFALRVRKGLAKLRDLDPLSPTAVKDADSLARRWADTAHPLADVAGILHTSAQSTALLAERKSAMHGDIETLLGELADTRANLATLRTDALGFHAKAAEAQEQLDEVTANYGSQARALLALDSVCAQKDRQLAWFRELHHALGVSNRSWRALLPAAMKRRRRAKLLRERGLFDCDAYLARYPDVKNEGVDPLMHYIKYGMAEGRHLDITADTESS